MRWPQESAIARRDDHLARTRRLSLWIVGAATAASFALATAFGFALPGHSVSSASPSHVSSGSQGSGQGTSGRPDPPATTTGGSRRQRSHQATPRRRRSSPPADRDHSHELRASARGPVDQRVQPALVRDQGHRGGLAPAADRDRDARHHRNGTSRLGRWPRLVTAGLHKISR